MKVMRSDSGSATTGMSVSLARPRKRKMTSTTSPNAMTSDSLTSLTLFTMLCERS